MGQVVRQSHLLGEKIGRHGEYLTEGHHDTVQRQGLLLVGHVRVVEAALVVVSHDLVDWLRQEAVRFFENVGVLVEVLKCWLINVVVFLRAELNGFFNETLEEEECVAITFRQVLDLMVCLGLIEVTPVHDVGSLIVFDTGVIFFVDFWCRRYVLRLCSHTCE